MSRHRHRWWPTVAAGAAAAVFALLAGCSASPADSSDITPATGAAATSSAADVPSPPRSATATPTEQAPSGPYAHTGPGDLQPAAAAARRLVYVPSQMAGTVQVIDPGSYTVVDRFRVGRSPEHVVPSHDLSTLWVNSDTGNALTPIDPGTGKPGPPVGITDPYNLYFTPYGNYALVMAERLRAIVVRDAHTMALVRTLPLPCGGVNHADFTADLSTLIASCEFSGQLMVVDADASRIIQTVDLNTVNTPGATPPVMARRMGGPAARLQAGASAMPQDVRLSPDGNWVLAADMIRNGVWVINAHSYTYDHFIPTGKGAHGIYPSRDATSLYVTNRDEGTISVLDAATLTPQTKWVIPGGGSPDMGGVTADGAQLWLSGRYNSLVYVFDTSTGALTHRIKVDPGPHGLLVWPQPGQFSLGHTGNMR